MGTHRAERTIEITASRETCFEVLLDFEAWPDWQPGFSGARVLERDAQGRGSVVEFKADAMVKKVRYSVRYELDPPARMSWSLVEGDLKQGDGEFALAELGPGRTRATYRLASDLGFYVPGPLMRKGTEKLMDGAVKGLKQRAEAL